MSRQLVDEDTRVRCWDCQHWTHHLQTSVYVHDETGRRVHKWIDCRTCAKGLAHDPIPLRRCDSYRELRPEHKMPLPKGALQGWGIRLP